MWVSRGLSKERRLPQSTEWVSPDPSMTAWPQALLLSLFLTLSSGQRVLQPPPEAHQETRGLCLPGAAEPADILIRASGAWGLWWLDQSCGPVCSLYTKSSHSYHINMATHTLVLESTGRQSLQSASWGLCLPDKEQRAPTGRHKAVPLTLP